MARRDNRIVYFDLLYGFGQGINTVTMETIGFSQEGLLAMCAGCRRYVVGVGVREGDATYCSVQCAENADGASGVARS